MVGLTLLQRCRLAGLSVRAEGDCLVVRGRRNQDALARALIANKAEVLAELAAEREAWLHTEGAVPLSPEDFGIRTVEDLFRLEASGLPPMRCFNCHGTRWWRLLRVGPWICDRCHPPQPPPEQIQRFNAQQREADRG